MPDRREFLYTAAALPFVARGLSATPFAADPPADVVSFSGLILRQQEPHNFEFPFTTLDRFILPTERFYVRNHFPAPTIDRGNWRLKVAGEGEHESNLTRDDVKKQGSQTRRVTLEGAGNG